MFEDYINRLKNEKVEPQEMFQINIANDVTLNPFIVEDKLRNINSLNDDELFRILSLAYPTILDKTFIDKNKVTITNAFTNERFVIILSQVLTAIQMPFTNEQKTNCNRLIYDYIVYQNNKKNSKIMKLLYNLGKTINRDIIPILCSLNLSEPLSVDLAIARYSTKNEQLAMARVNVVIMNAPVQIMTEQMIVWIYEKLFTHLTPMFEGIMFDVNEDEFTDEGKEEIYGLINLAILDILQEAPMDAIMSVLSSYAQDKEFLHSKDPVRFNIKSISVSDYDRILTAIDLVESERELRIPTH